MRALYLFLAAALFALPARANTGWNDCGTFEKSDVAEPAALRPNAFRALCHDTNATEDSTMLNVAMMDHISIHLDPDIASTGTGCEVQIYQCVTSTADTSGCDKMLGDVDGDGLIDAADDVTLNGTYMRHGFKWQGAAWIWVDVTANAGTDNCRTMVVGY